MDLKLAFSMDNIILGGDINMVQDDWFDRFSSKFKNHHYNPIVGNYCSSFCLYDPWRDLFPNICQYSWLKPDGTSKSRLDFWQISLDIKDISNCFISPAPISDHVHDRYPYDWTKFKNFNGTTV